MDENVSARQTTTAFTAAQMKYFVTTNVNWIQVMALEESKFKNGIKGLAITGWQRYDHFSVLAELFPVGIPSLAVNLLTSLHGFFNESIQTELYEKLDCVGGARQTFVDLTNDPYLWEKMGWCFFPGAQIFKLTKTLESVQIEVGNFLSKVQVEQGWLTDYSIRHNYTSPMRIDELMEEYQRVHFSVTNLIRHAQSSLSEFYDDYTVAEWIEQKIYPMISELEKLKKSAKELKQRKSWQSRPLPIIPELKEFGIGIPASMKFSAEPIPAAVQAPSEPQVVKGSNPDSPMTVRPKRLVQAPDYYRHPSSQTIVRTMN